MVRQSRKIWLIRHGETEWTKSGQHTGRTEIPLTEHGRQRAQAVGRMLRDQSFSLVLISPRQRAQDTARLAGLDAGAQIDDNLHEWDYGIYEGRTTADIQKEVPNWSIWDSPILEGETGDQVAHRADRVIERALKADGAVALFAHGHILRVLAARWIGLDFKGGRLLALDTGSVSILGYEHSTQVISQWNFVPSIEP